VRVRPIAGAVVAFFFAFGARSADAAPDCLQSYRDGQRLRTEAKLVEARRELVACSQDTCPAVYRRDCIKWLTDVDADLPTLALTVRGEDGCDRVDATVKVDSDESIVLLGDGRPVPINPGPHSVVVTLGERQQQQTVVVPANDHRIVVASFAPAGVVCGVKPNSSIVTPTSTPAPGPPPSSAATEKRIPLLSYVLGGVGVAGLAVGGAFGIVAWSEKGDLDSCKGHCGDRAVNTMERNFRVADIGIGAGMLALSAAVVVYLLNPRVPAPSTSTSTTRATRNGFVFTF